MDIRNIAIIAHVDHGKTTLVDSLLEADERKADHTQLDERAMDSDAQEKERGITIYAKNAAIEYKGSKINIVDTPGHADFGSEVQRILRTVDATVLVVDAYEGPMPQTKFVLSKSLELGLKVLVVINKIDKPMARPDAVVDMIFDLFAELGASDEQLDFAYMYSIARDGIALRNLNDEHKDISPLLDFFLEQVPASPSDTTQDFCMQPASLGYDNYLGRIAIGRVYTGKAKAGMQVTVLTPDGTPRIAKLRKVFSYQGMKRVERDEVESGDIVALAGIEDIYVGETISSKPDQEPLPAIKVDPPALAMYFMANDSPFAGREGSLVTGRNIRERLEKELETNVGLKLETEANSDAMKVYGRGEMHLAVLIENMRREGFELQVSQPEVVLQEINGTVCEPYEHVVVNVPDEVAGGIIQALGARKGEMKKMESENGSTMVEFDVPTRGLLGFRSTFVVLTKGEGTLYHSFDRFDTHCGPIEKRQAGSMISGETGKALGYSLFNLQDRGPLFIEPGTEVYEGMIIGEVSKGQDMVVNPLKGKKLTNVRASGSDEAIRLTPSTEINLERALEYIEWDEYVEVTPENIRLRKKHLTEVERKRAGK